MNIQIKSINDVLIIKCFDDFLFQDYLIELEKLLDEPIFNLDGYYPKAFFDFGSRNIDQNELYDLIVLLNKKQKILFDGIRTSRNQRLIEMYNDIVRNGDEIHVFNKTLFLSMIHPGSYIYCYDDVYFLNEVKGTIVLMNTDSIIYGHRFLNASIIINQKHIQNLTTLAFTSVYYKDEKIVCLYEEDVYGKNHSFNFR